MDVGADALRWLLERALTPERREVLKAIEGALGPARPIDLAPLFSGSRYRPDALAHQVLRGLQREGLVEKVTRGHYRLTALGRELAELIRRLGL